MVIELTPDLEQLVRDKAAESGMDASRYVEKILRESLAANGARQTKGQRKPISERFEEIRERAPADVRQALDELPSDFAAEHDHYLYGAPKKHA